LTFTLRQIDQIDINIIDYSFRVHSTVQKYSAVSTSNTVGTVVPRDQAPSAEARLVYGVGRSDDLGSVALPVTVVGTDKLYF
jgi:hypothetical protein